MDGFRLRGSNAGPRETPPLPGGLKGGRMGTGEEASEIVLVPDADHCIETVARDEFRRCVAVCLRSAPLEAELAHRLETLRAFLEQADFRRLRRDSEALIASGIPTRFVIRQEGGQAAWRMESGAAGEKQR